METSLLNAKLNVEKAKLKQKFASLTDDDLLLEEGKKEEMLGKQQILLFNNEEELNKILHKKRHQ